MQRNEKDKNNSLGGGSTDAVSLVVLPFAFVGVAVLADTRPFPSLVISRLEQTLKMTK